MYHIRLFIFGQRGDVGARVGSINLEEVVTLEVETPEDAPTLPQKVKAVTTRMGQAHHRDIVGLLVGHKHLSLHPVVVECLHEPVGSHSGSSGLFTGVDNEYTHSLILYY